jgi:hypothetical protein
MLSSVKVPSWPSPVDIVRVVVIPWVAWDDGAMRPRQAEESRFVADRWGHRVGREGQVEGSSSPLKSGAPAGPPVWFVGHCFLRNRRLWMFFFSSHSSIITHICSFWIMLEGETVPKLFKLAVSTVGEVQTIIISRKLGLVHCCGSHIKWYTIIEYGTSIRPATCYQS